MSEDNGCRLWDLRNDAVALSVLKAVEKRPARREVEKTTFEALWTPLASTERNAKAVTVFCGVMPESGPGVQ